MTLTPQSNTTLEQIAEAIRERDDFVICGHVSPDGDCLGSQLALWHALLALGKRATCILVKDEPVPASLSFMPGIGEMVPAAAFKGSAEVFIGLDVPTRERICSDACKILDECAFSITIDHHAVAQRMCDYAYVEADCASASMLVWELVKLLCPQPPAESALCAYTGLVTDTGSFRYQNCDSRAFNCAADLVAQGVDTSYVAANVYQSRSFASLKLEELTIQRMTVSESGVYALSWIYESDMVSLGAEKHDAEDLIDVLRSLLGVRVACILRGQDGVVRGSLRAKDGTDVSSLARELGGGGHRAAAGFTLHLDVDEAVRLLREKLDELLKEQPGD